MTFFNKDLWKIQLLTFVDTKLNLDRGIMKISLFTSF